MLKDVHLFKIFTVYKKKSLDEIISIGNCGRYQLNRVLTESTSFVLIAIKDHE